MLKIKQSLLDERMLKARYTNASTKSAPRALERSRLVFLPSRRSASLTLLLNDRHGNFGESIQLLTRAV